MKPQKTYNAWKEKKHQIDISHNFVDRVMNQVYRCEQERNISFFDLPRFVELISAYPLAKMALVAAGAVVGVARLITVIITVLSSGVANG